MKVWIVEVGEPLPLKGSKNRPYRFSQLFNKLSARGHDVVWWASDFSHQHKEKINSEANEITLGDNKTIRLVNMPAYKNNLSVMRVLSQAITGLRFYKLITNETPPDIIICAYPVIEMAFFSVLYSRSNNIPVIVDVQDLWPDIFWGVKNPLKRLLVGIFIFPFRLLARYTFKKTSSIVGISKGYLEFGLKYSGRNSSDYDAIFPLAYAKNDLISVVDSVKECIDSKKTIAWFVGSFGSTYDLSTVIKAAAEFDAKGNNDVVFVLTGDGDLSSSIKKESCGLKNIILTGWLSGPEINYIGENADIGLMTYAEGAPQGLPNKIIEYIAFGLPLVCSLTGESKELMDRGAIGCPYVAGDPKSLCSAVTKLLDEKIRGIMSQRAKKLFEKEFDSELVYAKYCDYLEGIFESGKSKLDTRIADKRSTETNC